MITLTRDEALTALNSIVEEKGQDYVYPESEKNENGSCHYRTDHGEGTEPSCIIANLIVKVGGDLSRVTEYQHAGMALREAGITVSTATEETLVQVQSYQDNGARWSEAVSMARDE